MCVGPTKRPLQSERHEIGFPCKLLSTRTAATAPEHSLAWLQCQFGWGPRTKKRGSIPHIPTWCCFSPRVNVFSVPEQELYWMEEQQSSPAMCSCSGACWLHCCLSPWAPAVLPLLSYQETPLYMRSQTLYKVPSSLSMHISTIVKHTGMETHMPNSLSSETD